MDTLELNNVAQDKFRDAITDKIFFKESMYGYMGLLDQVIRKIEAGEDPAKVLKSAKAAARNVGFDAQKKSKEYRLRCKVGDAVDQILKEEGFAAESCKVSISSKRMVIEAWKE